jgi:hypothetical protein
MMVLATADRAGRSLQKIDTTKRISLAMSADVNAYTRILGHGCQRFLYLIH